MTTISRRSVLAAGLASLATTPLRAQTATWNAYTYIPAATLPSAKGLARIAEGIDRRATAR
jgi:hypothetical protein